MSRLLRSQPPQPKLGKPVLPVPPVVTTLSINLATGVLTNQRRVQQRRTTSFFIETPPTAPPPVVTTLSVNLTPSRLSNQWARQRRIATLEPFDSRTLSELTGPPSVNSTAGFGTIGVPTASARLTPRLDTAYESLTVRLRKSGTPTDNALISIQTDSGGAPSGVKIFTANPIPLTTLQSAQLSRFTFDLGGLALTAGTPYWVVFERSGALDNSNAPVTERSSNAAYAQIWTTTATPQMVFPFGPRPPLIVSALKPVISALDVNFAARTRESKESIKRFPLQGWEGQETIETGGVGTVAPTSSQHGVGATAFGTTVEERTATSFIPLANATATKATIWLKKAASPTDNVVVAIQADAAGHPSGIDLGTVSVSGAGLTTTLAPVDFSGFSVPLSAGTTYWVIARRDGAIDNTNFYDYDNFAVNNSYAGAFFRTASGWTATTASLWFSLVTAGDNLGVFARNLGPRPPLFIDPAQQPPVDTTLAVLSTAVVQRAQFVRHGPKSLLFPPATLAQPPPNTSLLVSSTKVRRVGPVMSRLAAPAVVAPTPPFGPLFVNSTKVRRSGPTRSQLFAPVVVAPQFIAAPVEISRTRIRPRRTIWVLRSPRVLQTFTGPVVSLTAGNRRAEQQKLFPLQGWDGGVTQDGSVARSPLNVIDYFNRANENPLSNGGRWIRISLGFAVMQLTSSVAAGTVTATNAAAWGALGAVGDSQISCTIATPPALSADSVNLLLRIGGINSGANVETGYAARWQSGTGVVEILRLNGDNTSTIIGTTVLASPLAGDKMLFQIVGANMVVSVDRGSGWTAVLLAADATYASGDIGIGGRGTTFRIDDVQGGVLASGSGQQGNPSRNLGPRPPQIITPLPPLGGPAVNCLSPDRLARRFRRQLPTTALQPPTALQVFSGPAVHGARIRPRPVRSVLPETIVAAAAAAFAPRPVSVTLVHARPPKIQSALSGGLIRSRPAQRVQTVSTNLVRMRPQAVSSSLPLVIVSASQFVAGPITVSLARTTRARRPAHSLFPPAALQVFQGPTVARVRIRPRQTRHFLTAPTVLIVPSVEQQRRTLRTPLVHTRPRATTTFLNPPTVIRVPSVEQAERTVRVSLTHTRPRHTVAALRAPTALQTFSGPSVHTTRARPRPTRRYVEPPTVVIVPAVEQAEETIRVSLARIRPRPTVRTLSEPTVLQVFPGTLTPLVHTRPRPTVYRVDPPIVIRVPSVEQQEDTIKVSLARIRPRPTVRSLAAPTALQTFSGPRITLTRIRPRPTVRRLYAPTVVIPTPSQRAQTITVTLGGRTRLEMPRRAPIYDLRPPTVIISNPPVVTEITVSEVEPKNRRDQARRFPNQGQRQRLVRETGTTVTNQLRDPFIGPRPPQIVDPLPGQRAQTISEALVAVRTRREIPRHTVGHFLRPPTVVIPLPTLRAQTVQVTEARIRPRHTVARLRPPTVVDRTLYNGPETPLIHTRPRKTTSALFEPTVVRVPSVEAALRTIHVTLVRTRPRPTTRTLGEPTALRVFAAGRPALARIRPRHTISRLGPPTTLKEFFGPVETEVAVSTVTDRRRHLPHSHLSPPTVLAPTVTTTRETLTQIRPRPTTATLFPPTVVADRFAAAPVTVSLAPGRRPATRTTLGAPTVIDRFIPAPVTVSLAAGRRPAVTVTLSPPSVVAPPPEPVAVTILTALAVASTRRRFRTGRSFFPPVLPPYGPAKLPANTGYAVPATSANGDAVPAGHSDGDATPAAATEGRTLPVAESDGKAVPGTATTEGLK